MRLFFALELSAGVKTTIAELQKEFSGPGIRMVPPEQLHLTVAFLGEREEADVPRLIAAAKRLPLPERFSVQAEGVGSFASRVLWVGAGGEPLTGLLSLFHHAFTPAEKPPQPHITIGRVQIGASHMLDALKKNKEVKFGEVPVNAVFLKRSFLGGLPEYETVGEVPLPGM